MCVSRLLCVTGDQSITGHKTITGYFAGDIAITEFDYPHFGMLNEQL